MKDGWIIFGFLVLVGCALTWFVTSWVYCREMESRESDVAKQKLDAASQNDANVKLLDTQISTEQGARLEAQRESDKFEEMYHDDENAMVPLRQAAASKFASAAPDKRVDLLLQEMDVIKGDIESRTGSPSPYHVSDPLQTATATVSINVPNSNNYAGMMVGSTILAGFGKGTNPLLIATSNMSQAQSGPNGSVTITSTLQAAAQSLYMGQPVSNLKDAEYIQIDCASIPQNTQILGGTISWTINGSIPLTFQIPSQTENGQHIIIRDLSEGLKPLLSTPDK